MVEEGVTKTEIPSWEWDDFCGILYDNEELMKGWKEEGMVFDGCFLQQENGGPCGILMSIQAEYLVQHFFHKQQADDSPTNISSVDDLMSTPRMNSCWSRALATILVRACPPTCDIILLIRKDVDNYESSAFFHYSKLEKLTLSTKDVDQVSDILIHHPAKFLDQYTQSGGLLLFTMSLLWTRGKQSILQDMDDKTVLITSPFGHVSQELLNLCVTGRAVSNVWDDGHVEGLGGIPSSNNIGYLTVLEALRYVQVGSYYKFPTFPVWIIASSSHFTLLFGVNKETILKESESDKLLIQCKREFDKYTTQHEGMISTKDFPKLLAKFQSQLQHCCDSNITFSSLVETLQAALEMPGTNLILWDEFWKTCSRLLTGASLESVLHVPPTTINQSSSSTTATQPKSDEEYARELQAQFDAEMGVTNNSTVTSNTTVTSNSTFQQDNNTTTAIPNTTSTSEQEINSTNNNSSSSSMFGSTFKLYHYNALQGGTLSTLQVTRLSAEEVVGMSSSSSSSQQHAIKGDLEDIIHTKWPYCQISWGNGQPPSID